MSVSGPVVSIVIPCHNQGRFLGEAIERALRQTYPRVDVLVVDDGSTDETARVVSEHPGVGYVRQERQGAAVARTRGLRASRGEFVIFLDADDRLLPDAVAAGLDHFEAHPACAFVTGHVRVMTEDGSPIGVPPQEHPETTFLALLAHNYIWTPGAVMYRRSALDEIGAFDPSAGGSADYELNVRIARRFSFSCHHRVVLEYRQHPANMSRDAAHMLRSAMLVRRRQRTHVAGDRDAHRAWKRGVRDVQAHFGARLVSDIKADLLARGRRRRALQRLLCLLRFYPAGLAKLMTLERWRASRTPAG